MEWDFEQVAGPFNFTEGPVWDGKRLLFSDIPSEQILAYHPETAETTIIVENSGGSNGLKLDEEGILYACELEGRCVSRYIDGEREVLASDYRGTKLNSPNDLAIDHDGNIWFTDPAYEVDWTDIDFQLDHGSVYRIDQDSNQSLKRVTHDTNRPNGILVSPDGNHLYVAETDYGEAGCLELRSYPIDEDGNSGDHRVLHNFYPHRGIDGMCLDDEGNIIATAGWEKSGPGPMLYVFSPEGRVLETHPFPGRAPTNCTFGGGDLQSLYVTCHDGNLYKAETERMGYLKPPRKLRFD